MFDLLQRGIDLVELGYVPDWVTRLAIRRLCRHRIESSHQPAETKASSEFLDSLRSQPIALCPEKANEQHYELPAEFFEIVLGPHRKYSCCYFEDRKSSLDVAEKTALRLTCAHAELQNGNAILELGCGWGSLSLWMAEHYPDSRILAVSNSVPQRQFIEKQARQRSLLNLQVVTADINDFSTTEKFDRVISVEMFEHLRNFERVLRRILGWLKPHGKLLVHHFCHQNLAYPFEVEGAANWMGRYFFTGGIMPNAEMLSRFPADLTVTRRWDWSGEHYQRTADAWLFRLDQNRDAALSVLTSVYGQKEAHRWLHRWRMFFLAVSELFGYGRGNEWFVTHQLLEPTRITEPHAATAGTTSLSGGQA